MNVAIIGGLLIVLSFCFHIFPILITNLKELFKNYFKLYFRHKIKCWPTCPDSTKQTEIDSVLRGHLQLGEPLMCLAVCKQILSFSLAGL